MVKANLIARWSENENKGSRDGDQQTASDEQGE